MRVCAPHMPDFPGEWAAPSGWIDLSRSSRSSCYIGRVLLPMWLPAYLPKFPVAQWLVAGWIGLSGPSKSSAVWWILWSVLPNLSHKMTDRLHCSYAAAARTYNTAIPICWSASFDSVQHFAKQPLKINIWHLQIFLKQSFLLFIGRVICNSLQNFTLCVHCTLRNDATYQE